MNFSLKLFFVFLIIYLAVRPACALSQSKTTLIPSSHSLDGKEAALYFLAHLTVRAEFSQASRFLRAGNIRGAESMLAHYFRTRQAPLWPLGTQPPSQNSLTIANDAVMGRVQGGLVPLKYTFAGNDIDWHFNATDWVAGHPHNDEWQWQLNRMAFWSDLAHAYRATGDERYAQAFARQLRTWLQQCPEPDHVDNAPGSQWRTIEAGIRSSQSWMDAFEGFRQSPSLTDEELLQFVEAFMEHGEYLRKYHSRLNWLTMEMCGLYTIGAMFPEFLEAQDWRSFATMTMFEQAHTQFLPDGAQMELSSGYQNVSLDAFLRIIEIARQLGYQKELPENYVKSLEKGYDWQEKIVAPDGNLPKLNDSWPTSLMYVMHKAVQLYPERKDFLWFASDRKNGQPPRQTSYFLNWSGLAAMRSGWGKGDNYLLFRLGAVGAGHQHQDSLGLALWAYGREILFNEGGGSYEQSKWRSWSISAYAHNTIVVDGMAQNVATGGTDIFHDPNQVSQVPVDGHWISNAEIDYASGSYRQGYGLQRKAIAVQTRQVLFIKPDIYLVVDSMIPSDLLIHSYQARWQLQSVHTVVSTQTKALQTIDDGLPNLLIVPLYAKGLDVRVATAQEEPEILGWDIRKDISPAEVPATTLMHTIRGAGMQKMMTLLMPLHVGEDHPVTSVQEQSAGQSVTVCLQNENCYAITTKNDNSVTVQVHAKNKTTCTYTVK